MSTSSTLGAVALLLLATAASPVRGAMSQTVEQIELVRYPYENHTIRTSDGYLLTSFRIPGGKDEHGPDPTLPPVVIFHGLLSSSVDFVIMKEDSIPFMLADAGYDVWLSNMRHSENAKHATLCKESDDYWDFSLDEHAKYDMPETIDYVLSKTSSDKVVFLGISLANTLYMMMLNERPDIVDKVAVNVVFSPVYFNSDSKWLGPIWDTIKEILLALNINHIDSIVPKQLVDFSLNLPLQLDPVQVLITLLFGESDIRQIRMDNRRVMYSRRFAFSVKQMSHFLQIVERGKLAKFDYGPESNKRIYGSEEAPVYSWRHSNAPFVIYCGNSDIACSKKDLKKIVKMFDDTNSTVYWKFPKWKLFNHVNYISSVSITKMLNENVIRTLKEILSHVK